jgi:hypothetical protein
MGETPLKAYEEISMHVFASWLFLALLVAQPQPPSSPKISLVSPKVNEKQSPTSPKITLVSPKGNEKWILGTTETIVWNASGVTGQVRISLLQEGWNLGRGVIAHVPVGSGSYAWTIGKLLPPYTSLTGKGSGFRIRVEMMVGNVSTESPLPFAIAEMPTATHATLAPGALTPTITSFSPHQAGSGDTIVISGDHFYGDNEPDFHFGDSQIKVLIGNFPNNSEHDVRLKVISTTTIYAIATPWSSSGPITVITKAGSASVPGFTMLYKPWDLYGNSRVYWVDGSRKHGLIVADWKSSGCWDSGSMTCPYDCALQNIANFKGDGFTDWRLPTRDELIKLHNANPAQYGLTDNLYWTGEDAGNGTNWAVYVFMQPGPGEGWQVKVPRTYSLKFHAVRSF